VSMTWWTLFACPYRQCVLHLLLVPAPAADPAHAPGELGPPALPPRPRQVLTHHPRRSAGPGEYSSPHFNE